MNAQLHPLLLRIPSLLTRPSSQSSSEVLTLIIIVGSSSKTQNNDNSVMMSHALICQHRLAPIPEPFGATPDACFPHLHPSSPAPLSRALPPASTLFHQPPSRYPTSHLDTSTLILSQKCLNSQSQTHSSHGPTKHRRCPSKGRPSPSDLPSEQGRHGGILPLRPSTLQSRPHARYQERTCAQARESNLRACLSCLVPLPLPLLHQHKISRGIVDTQYCGGDAPKGAVLTEQCGR